jgi:hypothetical protein
MMARLSPLSSAVAAIAALAVGAPAADGPAIGQIDRNIGPTIISPAVTNAVIVTGNNVAIGP